MKIVLRLVGGDSEGRWIYVDRSAAPFAWRHVNMGHAIRIELSATGSVEWHGDDCAEVYVPTHLLDVWRAEHAA